MLKYETVQKTAYMNTHVAREAMRIANSLDVLVALQVDITNDGCSCLFVCLFISGRHSQSDCWRLLSWIISYIIIVRAVWPSGGGPKRIFSHFWWVRTCSPSSLSLKGSRYTRRKFWPDLIPLPPHLV
jgi:hypothetical protein